MIKHPLIAAGLLVLLCTTACKEKPHDPDPSVYMAQWVRAIEARDYSAYAAREAYPLSKEDFLKRYKDHWFSDLLITRLGDYDPEKIHTDHQGMTGTSRLLYFEMVERDRASGAARTLLSGDVLFVNYTEGPLKEKGWVMLNRSFVRIPSNIEEAADASL